MKRRREVVPDEAEAFTRGKLAARMNVAAERNPFTVPTTRAAWARGHAYETNLIRGLRPLDTARRKP